MQPNHKVNKNKLQKLLNLKALHLGWKVIIKQNFQKLNPCDGKSIKKGLVGGWGVKALLRIAYSNTKDNM